MRACGVIIPCNNCSEYIIILVPVTVYNVMYGLDAKLNILEWISIDNTYTLDYYKKLYNVIAIQKNSQRPKINILVAIWSQIM